MEFLLDEYMTYYMFKDDDDSDYKTSVSSSLSASVGVSFFKFSNLPIPVNPRIALHSKALSEGPSTKAKSNISCELDAGETVHNSSPLLTKNSASVITGSSLKTPEFEFVSGFSGLRSDGGETDNYLTDNQMDMS